ncbi:MAG: hypothetical protein M3N43_04150 [Actinomycetota bacterium]|nr:hypothetical protein [Actinomycetota bacterium]
MNQPDDPGFLLWLLLFIPIGDLVATVFFGYLFWISKRESVPGGEQALTTSRFSHPLVRFIGRPLRFVLEGRSWLLSLLAASFGIITVVFCWVGFVVVRRLVGLPPLPIGTTAITTLLIVLLGTIPILFMVAFWLTRRSRGGPPPFGERD